MNSAGLRPLYGNQKGPARIGLAQVGQFVESDG
jgi:hypothetical protein